MPHSVAQYVSQSADTSQGLSPALWQDCPVYSGGIGEPSIGVGNFCTDFWDDFIKPPTLVTPTITTEANLGNGWKGFGESPSTIISVNPANGGHVELLMSDDNEAVSMAMISLPFKIISGGGDFWGETRIKRLNITDTTLGWIFGLMDQQTLANDVPILDAGTLATTINFWGWWAKEGDGDAVDAVYQANGVTLVENDADAATMAADTYTKLGMTYNDTTKKVNWWVNGVKTTTTKTLPTAAGTDFPNDIQMGLIFSALGANAADASITSDWVRAVQRRV